MLFYFNIQGFSQFLLHLLSKVIIFQSCFIYSQHIISFLSFLISLSSFALIYFNRGLQQLHFNSHDLHNAFISVASDFKTTISFYFQLCISKMLEIAHWRATIGCMSPGRRMHKQKRVPFEWPGNDEECDGRVEWFGLLLLMMSVYLVLIGMCR